MLGKGKYSCFPKLAQAACLEGLAMFIAADHQETPETRKANSCMNVLSCDNKDVHKPMVWRSRAS